MRGLLISLLPVVVVACARPAAPVSTDLLLLGGPERLQAFDASTGRLGFSAIGAVPTADWSRLVKPVYDDRGARLVVLDGRTGREQASVALGERLEVGAVSTSGRRVALVELGSYGPLGQSRPTPRARTHIVVVDIVDGGRTSYDLEGNYVPEAFSSDDQRLFLLDFLPASAPDRYRVRQLHLGSQRFVPMIDRWKKFPVEFEEEMRGIGRTQLLSHDRRTLYTLYVHQPDHRHGRELARLAIGQPIDKDVHAFVHVLDLAEGSAFCVDLPAPFGATAGAAHVMALSPDGQKLYVAEPGADVATSVDSEKLTAGPAQPIGLAARPEPATPPSMAATPDGALFLTAASDLVRLDPTTLRVAERWPLGDSAEGLAVSPDARRLYVGLRGRVIAIDATTGQPLGEIATGAGFVRQAVLAR